MRAFVIAALLAAVPAHAWDTYVNHAHNWRSIYENKYGGTGSHTDGTARGNEHAEITDETLFTIDPSLQQLFGAHALSTCAAPNQCAHAPRVVDLNASIMRPDLFGIAPNPLMQSKLEERQLPALSMWAGLPDFNYTVYDWINKSERCAALPLDADRYELCHVYRAWLGAGLNSTHMGDLAVEVYGRHHGIAVKQAQRAAELRALLRAGGRSGQLPPGDRWYADYVREAELLSLSYEVVGQHFLHDRWSIGHMISRWGGGSLSDHQGDVSNGRPVRLGDVSRFGTLTGIVHGSLAVFGTPDPLCAPLVDYGLVGDDSVKTMTWRYSQPNRWFSEPDRSVQRGVGDYYYADVFDDRFNATVLNPTKSITPVSPAASLKVGTQHKIMNTCAGEGLRQVIASFDAQGGKFGELGLPLPAPDPNKTMPGATANGTDPSKQNECTDGWATNDSYYTAARTIAGPSWLLGDGWINTFVMAGTAESEPEIPESIRREFHITGNRSYTPPIWPVIQPIVVVMFRSHANMRRDERRAAKTGQTIVRYGVESARDGLSFVDDGLHFRGNGAYAVPEYYEPEDLDTLPWFSEQREDGKIPSGGRDRAAIDGFFNKARTESWCKTLYGTERLDKEKAVTLRLLREQALELERTGKTELAARYRAACGYLANRVYKGVDPQYPMNGSRYERIGEFLPFDSAQKYGAAYEPICSYFDGAGGTAIRTADAADDGKPYFIKPGYVEQPGKRGDDGYAPKTLENWCEMVPVLDVGRVPGGDPDAAGQIDHLDGDRWLKLKGENLGIKTGAGKVGQVLATDAQGTKRSLDIWDGMLKQTSGGWSYDNQTVWARISGSKKGFPTDATPSMRPDEVMKLAPRKYEVELVRPDDATAKIVYRANGARTVGRYVVEVNTSWIEQRDLTPQGTSKYKGLWVTHPAWSRGETEVLHDSVYTVAGGVYTKVDLAAFGVTVEYRDGFEPQFDSNGQPYWVAAADKRGYLFSHPIELPTSIFNSTSSFFFSFH